MTALGDPAAPADQPPPDPNVLRIAEVCHEANRAYCRTIGDFSQPEWDEAPNWQRDSARAAVRFRLDNPEASEGAQHDQWTRDKLTDGWTFGEVKDADKKTHPCLVPFDQLPVEQQRKDRLFAAIVRALT